MAPFSLIGAVDFVAAILFVVAILHTFSVKWFQERARRYPEGSIGENFFHLIGEVEVVFGIYAAIYLLFRAGLTGGAESIQWLEELNFTEPAFVFVIMTVCATRPVLEASRGMLRIVSKLLPLPEAVSFYFVALSVGTLLGSFITEPAAMTVVALLLLERFYRADVSDRFKYVTIAVLFVNISVGGTLTPYAAPPVLMVAGKWNWDLAHMLTHFGWRSALIAMINAGAATAILFKELSNLKAPAVDAAVAARRVPYWVRAIHLVFLAAIVFFSHHLVVFAGIFLFFLGLVTVTREFQDEMNLRQGLLVAFFLGGLVVLGAPQRWWLEPMLSMMNADVLFFGATALTAITDNAALTYLGSQVPTLSDAAKFALVSGAVTGGGLTVIANAPNPAGYGILNASFGEDGISPLQLFLHALPPTVVAVILMWAV
jgi:hypothetical protein